MFNISPREFFNSTWYMLIAIVFCFFMGMMVGEVRAEIQCNNFILEEYIKPAQTLPVNNSSSIFPFVALDVNEPSEEQGYT